MFTELNDNQIQAKIDFITNYLKSNNAADGSFVDANANVTQKNIATLEAELHKDINIQINRMRIKQRIEQLYDKDTAEQYITDINNHYVYCHDSTRLAPYCVSVTMYPLLLDGLTGLGGESKAPKHLASFCGTFVNFIFATSAQFAGAVATVEFLMYFDYYARKDFGDNYLDTHRVEIQNHLQHVVYAINQPAAARGYQSCFWNISCYDEPYFESMFGDFVFPDGEKADKLSVMKLQQFFLTWFNEERTKSVLTFPVVTCAVLSKDGTPSDKRFADEIAEQLANGNSFFIYMSESADALASCCRLRNSIEKNPFSFSLGAGGVATGSIQVITLNVNRIIQDAVDVVEVVRRVHKYQHAYRTLIDDLKSAGMLTVYDAGFITLDKQYLTVGLNGVLEAAEFLNMKPTIQDPNYQLWLADMLERIADENKEFKKRTGYMANTEIVPAENLGIKNYDWDKKDGYVVPENRNCYNSYFYAVEDDAVSLVDKFVLHGKPVIDKLDGGSALHANLDSHLPKDGYLALLDLAAKAGTNYFCFNVRSTLCIDCGHISKDTLDHCEKCGSEKVDHLTRIIGYLKRIAFWSAGRRKEHVKRHYHD